MKTAVSLKVKVRDFAIGFFGWLILGNLIFVFLFWLLINVDWDYALPLISSAVWLSTIIATLVLLIKKRIWIFTGILTAFAMNGIFMVFGSGIYTSSLGDALMLMGFPAPVGVVPFVFGQ